MEKLVLLYKDYLAHIHTKERTSYYTIYVKAKEKALKTKEITYIQFVNMP